MGLIAPYRAVVRIVEVDGPRGGVLLCHLLECEHVITFRSPKTRVACFMCTVIDSIEGEEPRERPKKPDEKRVDAGDWMRASGDVKCRDCGFEYREHDTVRGYRWLHRLCSGRLVKL